jgi:hypothetical protein
VVEFHAFFVVVKLSHSDQLAFRKRKT